MLVRHCRVRVVVRQPWLFDDPQALSVALTRLVTDVLVDRLSARLDRLGQPAQLGTVRVAAVLPVSDVLAVSGNTCRRRARRMTSFGAEVTVHNAINDALAAAFEQVALEHTDPRDLDGLPPIHPSPAASTAGGQAHDGGTPVTWQLRTNVSAGTDPFQAVERIRAAVSDTLLAAARSGRLWNLLRRIDSALTMEWIKVLRPDPGSPGIYDAGISWVTGAGEEPATQDDGRHRPAPTLAADDPERADLGFAQETAAEVPDPGRIPSSASGAPGFPSAPAAEVFEVEPTVPSGWGDPETGSRPGPVDGGAEAGQPAPPSSRSAGGVTRSEAGGPFAAPGIGPWDSSESGAAAVTDEKPASDDADEGGPPERSGFRLPVTTDQLHSAANAVLGRLGISVDLPATHLAAAVSVADRLHLSPSDPRVWHAIESLSQVALVAAELPAAEGGPPPVPSFPPAVHGRPPRRVLDVGSILPFLLVGPLDNLGVLDAVAATLATTDSTELLTAFAACLARKALPPPINGWRQPTEFSSAVAAFVGGEEPPDGEATERLAHSMSHWWPAVEEVLTAAVVGLRDKGSPLVVARSPGGFVVADADGLTPLLWNGDRDAVRSLWERCGRPRILTDPTGANPFADLQPTDNPAEVAPLIELLAFAGERPAGGRADLVAELDDPISFVVGVALAALAWGLWERHGERTHPVLAATRLEDLDGRVLLEPSTVVVRMPIGRRHADLRDSGLLRTVTAVPWLGGRSLELQGG